MMKAGDAIGRACARGGIGKATVQIGRGRRRVLAALGHPSQQRRRLHAAPIQHTVSAHRQHSSAIWVRVRPLRESAGGREAPKTNRLLPEEVIGVGLVERRASQPRRIVILACVDHE
jgi:hypothetical protein